MALAGPPKEKPHLSPSPKNAGRPRRSRRGWIGVGRAGLDAQAANQTQVVPEPSMGEGNAAVEAPSFRAGRTSTSMPSVSPNLDHRHPFIPPDETHTPFVSSHAALQWLLTGVHHRRLSTFTPLPAKEPPCHHYVPK